MSHAEFDTVGELGMVPGRTQRDRLGWRKSRVEEEKEKAADVVASRSHWSRARRPDE